MPPRCVYWLECQNWKYINGETDSVRSSITSCTTTMKISSFTIHGERTNHACADSQKRVGRQCDTTITSINMSHRLRAAAKAGIYAAEKSRNTLLTTVHESAHESARKNTHECHCDEPRRGAHGP